MPKITSNGAALSLRQRGEGPDVVFVHGLAANSAFWNLEMVRTISLRRRVTLFDLRGHGYSDMPPSGYTVPELSRDLAGLLDALEIERAHLVAHSYGGLVALDFAVAAPERVMSLTLADSRVPSLQPSVRLRDWTDADTAMEELRSYGIEMDDGEHEVGLKLLELMADAGWRASREGADQGGLWTPFGSWSRNSRSARRWLTLLRETSAGDDFRNPVVPCEEAIRSLPMPVLGLYGETSRCRATLERLEQILPGFRGAVIEGAGHFHPLVKPAVMTKYLLDFFDEIETAALPTGGGA